MADNIKTWKLAGDALEAARAYAERTEQLNAEIVGYAEAASAAREKYVEDLRVILVPIARAMGVGVEALLTNPAYGINVAYLDEHDEAFAQGPAPSAPVTGSGGEPSLLDDSMPARRTEVN